jgi:K+/H+ antiporter YhaU regulatory subunit KhtT
MIPSEKSATVQDRALGELRRRTNVAYVAAIRSAGRAYPSPDTDRRLRKDGA